MPQGTSVSAAQFAPGVLVTGTGLHTDRAQQERDEIHQGSVDFLSKHTEKEILEERQKMLEMIGKFCLLIFFHLPAIGTVLVSINKPTYVHK